MKEIKRNQQMDGLMKLIQSQGMNRPGNDSTDCLLWAIRHIMGLEREIVELRRALESRPAPKESEVKP